MTLKHVNLQSPSSVVMVRPHNFTVNLETVDDNAFQNRNLNSDANAFSKLAYDEFNQAVNLLENSGIKVHLFDDDTFHTPDSVFPNNWFSTHPDGSVVLYPMYAPNRRKERRSDVMEMLKHEYSTSQIVDYSGLEQDNIFLEGTGAMVIDHINRVAFMISSKRANPGLFERFCTQFNYEPFVFNAVDIRGKPIYHTNVFMSIATNFAMLSLEMIPDAQQRQ